MNVLHIQGSPRINGNSAAIANALCTRLAGGGASITTHNLNELVFKGCQGCEACKTKRDKCIIRDGLEPVLEDVMKTDVLVMSTPVYWGDVSGQLKCCIDRFYSFLKPGFKQGIDMHRLPGGKQFVFIQSQGASDESQFGDIFTRYNSFFEQLKFFSASYHLQGCGLNDRGDAMADEEFVKKVDMVAGKIVHRWRQLATDK